MPNDKLPSILGRLYTKDLEKRKQNKQILTKIYTPTFTPFLYSKDVKKYKKPENNNNRAQSQTNRNRYHNYKNYNTIDENHDEENNYDDNEDNSENEYEEKKKKKVKLIKIKKAKSKGKTKVVSAKVKFNLDDSSDYAEEKKNEKEDKEEIQHDRAEVENALRNRLFRRNKSVTKRKN